uniref:SSD domain-containing protein n=1 Tax=Setaria digitata TaxID=48799 RepID=A0A915PIF6_9BILA
MLREREIREVYEINQIMTDVLNNVKYFGMPICHPFCQLNEAVRLFWDELNKNVSSIGYDKDAIFSFPKSTILGQELFLGSNLFGVQSSGNVSKSEKNLRVFYMFFLDHVFPNRSTIIRVQTIMFWYLAVVDNPRKLKILQNVTFGLFEMSKRKNATKWINFNIFGDEIANREIIRGAYEATKLMIVGFVFLVCFMFLIMWHRIELHLLPQIVFAAIFSPLLAATASFGIISWLQLPVYSMMCITPFLVLGIGVDDAFIMIQAWSHLRDVASRKDRLAKVFIQIGPSISITSITNLIAFGIGYLTPTPQMSLFCLCTSFACLFDYIFTFTLLAPILYLVSKSEDGYLMARKQSKNKLSEQFIASYCKLICSWKGRTIAVILMIILYFLSLVGVMNMKSTFEPFKAFPSDSMSSTSSVIIRNVFDDFFPLQVVINKPPNISDSVECNEFYDMIRNVEAIPNSYGPNQTIVFLKIYEDFDRKMHDLFYTLGIVSQEYFMPSYDNLPIFLEHIRNPPFIKMKSDEKGGKKLAAFVITTMAKNMSEWSKRAVYVDACRSLFRNYPRFNATVYDGDSAILDLILTAKTDLIGSITVTVLSLVGSLSWWGADMDPVTMVDVLIATGFSVDYTAHIAYKFYKLVGEREERIKQSFREMSGPMLQAGISTVLCMLPLIFVPTYAILAFAKTVFLNIGLALLHGLFILPVLLVNLCRDNQKENIANRTTLTSGRVIKIMNGPNLLEK